jgi:hypothetical protein
VRVPLSAGDHSIVIDNLGEDWLEIAYLELGHLVAPARALTLRDSDNGVVLAWLQHRAYTWDQVNEARNAILLEYRLSGMAPGRYVAEIWDPLSGAVLGEELLRVGEDGLLAVNLLPLDRQLALRAIRQAEPVADNAPPALATNTPLP